MSLAEFLNIYLDIYCDNVYAGL